MEELLYFCGQCFSLAAPRRQGAQDEELSVCYLECLFAFGEILDRTERYKYSLEPNLIAIP